jgi:hypothetical protein
VDLLLHGRRDAVGVNSLGGCLVIQLPSAVQEALRTHLLVEPHACPLGTLSRDGSKAIGLMLEHVQRARAGFLLVDAAGDPAGIL